MTNKDAKLNLLEHSAAKVWLLQEYLTRYLNIICNDNYTTRIKIFDLFCSVGLYENGGEGSPLVILRETKNIYFKNNKKEKFPKIDCYFNDKDIDKIESLKKNINEKSLYYPVFGELEFSTNDFNILYEKLLKDLSSLKSQNQKAFIFIDPYGYKNIKTNHIKDLMALDNTEVLLWLPIQFMYRFATSATPEALHDFIEELGLDSDELKLGNVWNFVGQLKVGFQKLLGKKFFVDTFTIKKDSNTLFCLFFFTSHIKGFEKMIEAKWEIDTEQGNGWNYTENQQSLFHDSKINPLEKELEKFLIGKNCNNGELYEFILRQGFLPKHANAIFKNWQETNKLDVLTLNGKKARKSSFYIGYDYYKNENNKVTFIIR